MAHLSRDSLERDEQVRARRTWAAGRCSARRRSRRSACRCAPASSSVELATGALGDLARQLLAVGADQPRDVVAFGGDALLLERAQPRLDACLDRVDERAIEVEDERARAAEARRDRSTSIPVDEEAGDRNHKNDDDRERDEQVRATASRLSGRGRWRR